MEVSGILTDPWPQSSGGWGDNRRMSLFRRYVAIGDSNTEGLEDPDGLGGYRGWADRLAQHVADGQIQPLEYANLAIRGLRMAEIRMQFEPALALEPDLMTIFGGVNDVIAMRCDFAAIRADYATMFAEAQRREITVATFTMPDPAAINPLGKQLRDRMYRLDDLIREEAETYGVLVLDLQRIPIAEDPRLWFEDRLHGNPLGHERVSLGLAFLLGVEGATEAWTDPIDEDVARPRPRAQLAGDLDWAVHYLAPWLGKGLRGIRLHRNITPKRPVPTVVVRTPDRSDETGCWAPVEGP